MSRGLIQQGRLIVQGQSRAARLFLAAFCALFFAISFSYIIRAGRLTLVPIYDDVSYLNDAISRLTYLDAGGILGFLKSFTFMPAHSPVLAVIGTLGFLFGAEQYAAPYAFNGVWLVAMALLAWRTLDGLPDWSRVGIIVAMFAAPMFGYLISEFRPDIGWGLLVGFSLVLTASADLTGMRYPAAIRLGLLIGLAVLTKPSGMPAAIVIIGSGIVLQSAACFLLDRRAGLAPVLRRSASLIATALAPIILYLCFSWEHVWEYIYAALVTDKDVWTTRASLWGHISFYLNHFNGTILLGWFWYACLPIWAACIVVLAAGRRYALLVRFCLLLLAVLIAYAVPTASVMKTFHLGSIFYGPVIAASVYALGLIASSLKLSPKIVLAVGAAIFVVAWTPKTGNLGRDNPTMVIVNKANEAIFPTIIEKMQSRAPGQPPVTLFFSVPGPAYDATIDFWARQQRQFGRYLTGYTWTDWAQYLDAIKQSDIVVAADQGIIGQPDNFSFPSVGYQGRIIDTLRNDPAFESKRAFVDPQGRAVWLFIRKASFPQVPPAS